MLLKTLHITLILLFSVSSSFSQEICNNGIDDDLDGLIDLNDTTDCFCEIGVLPPIIPNPSFESFSSCPSNASQIAKVDFWQDASTWGTSDYFNCSFSIPATSTPFPHGTGTVGFAVGNGVGKEFFGTCLLDTLYAGVTYNLQFQYAQIASFTPRPIAIYGTDNCVNLPYTSSITTYCPELDPNWITLDTLVPLVNTSSWNTYSFSFTPALDITTIAIGPSCTQLFNVSQAYYGTIDNLQLSSVSRSVNISETGHYCRNNLVLTANYDSIPNSYQWYKNGIALINDTNNSYSIPNLGTGNYQVLLNYNDGCVLSTIHLVDSPIIDFDYDTSGSCINNHAGKINLKNIAGGTIPYEFSTNSLPFTLDSTFDSLSPGVYTVSVRDSNLCLTKKNITIIAFSQPFSNFSSDTVCLGSVTTILDQSIINKGTITKWDWNTPINSSSQNINFTFINSGVIPVTLTVTSDSGCMDDTTLNLIVNPLPILDFDYTPNSVSTYDTEVCFTNYSIGAINYFWDFDFTGPNSTSTLISPCPILFPDDKGSSYNVKLNGINQFGCIDSIIKTIIIKNDFIVYIPNSFTPNNDRINDEISVVHKGIESLEWMIFNRWGEQIFHSTDLNNSWNGFHDNELVPTGCYPYRLIIISKTGHKKEFFGQINLLK